MAQGSQLDQQLDKLAPPDQLPAHVAVIMDGNARWARKNNVQLSRGHREGAERAREITEFCRRADGIRVLTLFAFSTENWERPDPEVDTLFDLLLEFLRRETDNLLENDIRLRVLGKLEELPDRVENKVREVTERTNENSAFELNLALNYGARDEIIRSVRSIANLIDSGNLKPGDVNADLFAENLDTAGQPAPDLLVRTSGERRLSNFLLWQLAYAELCFTETLWPDFDSDAMRRTLEEFSERERRFGRRVTEGE